MDVETSTLPERRWTPRRMLLGALGFAIVVAVFALALPEFADYADVFEVVRDLGWLELGALALATVWNVITYAPPYVAAVPGLGFRRALALTQAAAAVTSLLPGGEAFGLALIYRSLRRWGTGRRRSGIAVLFVTMANQFAKVAFPLAAVGLLAIAGETQGALTAAALLGLAVLAVGVALAALVFAGDGSARAVGRLFVRVTAPPARLVHRAPAADLPERIVGFRHDAVGLLRRRGLAVVAGALVGHFAVFIVLLVALRGVGVASGEVSATEAFAAWALVRLLTAIPITPGGLGVVELGLSATLVAFGGDDAEVVAAVLLYRALTWALPVIVGLPCLLVLRRPLVRR